MATIVCVVHVIFVLRTYVHVRDRHVRPSQRPVDARKTAARPDFDHSTPHEVSLRENFPAVHVAAVCGASSRGGGGG